MAEYIEREAVVRYIDARIKSYQEVGDRISIISLKFARGAISEIPAADVVPVVRCKDCKHYKPEEYECGCDFGGGLPYVKADDFCSYGDRMDGEP